MRGALRQPETLTRWLLGLFLVGICSRGYGYYNQMLIHSPQLWVDVLHGTASAPDQYRVGVVKAAYWVTQHTGWGGEALRLSQVFGIFDLVGSIVAAMLLYRLLEISKIYRQSETAMRWFASAAFVALTIYAVDWTNWYQKVGTLPTAGMVAMMVWLWSSNGETTAAQRGLRAAGILLLVALQSTVRADIALMLCLGVLAVSVLGIGDRLALPRGAAIATSLFGLLVAGGMQFYLMKVRYPHASYGGVPAFMLPHDVLRPTEWAATLIYLAPLLWTIVAAVRRRSVGEGMGAALLVSAVGYAVLWICLGRLDEVRIFLPMALATVPLTVEMAMLRVAEAQA
jgi:hypothetical protein